MFTTIDGRTIRHLGDRVASPVPIPENHVSKTKQEFKDDADINVLVKRFLKHGVLPQGSASAPVFADLTENPTYTEALNAIAHADSMFEQLPATLREEFLNDPAELLGFLADPENQEEAIKLGLADAPPPPEKIVPSNADDPIHNEPPATPPGDE